MNQRLKKDIKTTIFIILSALIYSFSLKVFVQAGQLFPGGFSGISLLITRSLKTYANISIPFSLVYLLLNAGPTLLVYKYVGKRFTIFSVMQYLLVSLFVQILPSYQITGDIILIAVFGGILSGFGNSLALRVNASSGGTDFIAIYASTKVHVPTWTYILYGNTVVLIIAGLLFGWQQALYSIIYQFCSTQVVTSQHLRYKLMSLFIITEKPDEITAKIFSGTRHGITKIWGEGGFSKQPKCMLFMVVNAFEVDDVVEAAKAIDPHVFIDISKSERIIGNYYQKPLD